ncbi:GtrA family protein [Paenibacillus sp. WLX2291]|uniref:GtrA family protein n=1 Tax=Paenibacillus sp. WLX2291 TaxID=3296934 RepID=UPI0039842099
MINRKEIINYIIFGVLTTVVNIVSYIILVNLLYMDYRIATTIAWIISVLFAFFTNKKYVFKSEKGFMKEMVLFFGARLLSYFIDLMGMILLVEGLTINDTIAKILVNIIVILVNYFISKLIVFKQTK